jgi:hypothetical protein
VAKPTTMEPQRRTLFISINPATRSAIHLEIVPVKNGLGGDNDQD